jgi:peptidoglycan/xylan/chitin deacetylase (PgdA/CDA1 family)
MTLFSRRDFLKLSGISLLAVAAGNFVSKKDEYPSTPTLWHGSRRYRYMAFTYDDCYKIKELHGLEKLLDKYPDFRITLFPVGRALLSIEEKDPGIWKRFVDKGHEIGYHTFDHINLGVMSPQNGIADFDKWSGTLTQLIGKPYPVRFVRPPYDVISYTLNVLCLERGLVSTLFSVGGGGPTDVVMNAIRKAKNGDIVQMHIRNTPESQDYDTSVEAFAYLKSENIGAVTLSHLYNDLLLEQSQPQGCELETGTTLTRWCID